MNDDSLRRKSTFPPEWKEKHYRPEGIFRVSRGKTGLRMESVEKNGGICGSTLERLAAAFFPDEPGLDVDLDHPVVAIKSEIVPFLPVFALIDGWFADRPQAVLAIDGPSGSGKSLLSRWLAAVYGCETVHMDDFFLPRERATPERLAESGGNIDYERLVEEVAVPLRKSLPVRYRRFDCQTQVLSDPISLSPTRLLVVEGVYSLHPRLRPIYDMTVFLDVSAPKKWFRIVRRNGSAWRRSWKHLTVWIPLENRYFKKEGLRKTADLILRT